MRLFLNKDKIVLYAANVEVIDQSSQIINRQAEFVISLEVAEANGLLRNYYKFFSTTSDILSGRDRNINKIDVTSTNYRH